ncbi:MAG: very short patch repair endonuclease [Kiritimatiellales bacterium]
MDHLTPEQRSWNMSRIKGKDTKPEVLVRSMLHRAGYRFRKNVSTLPGKPDIVLPKYKTVIFVHGCFWHRHKGCKDATTPKSNKAFWKKKFERNTVNDKKHARELRKLGWKVVTVWSCQLKKPDTVLERLETSLATINTKRHEK